MSEDMKDVRDYLQKTEASANLHFSSQVSCVFLCFRVSGNTETWQHEKYITITLEVNNDQPLDICVSQRKGPSGKPYLYN